MLNFLAGLYLGGLIAFLFCSYMIDDTLTFNDDLRGSSSKLSKLLLIILYPIAFICVIADERLTKYFE